MAKTSAGILIYRLREDTLEVLLVHPGGPFWAKKDLGAWSIPKGEIAEGEDPLAAARRELQEETGLRAEGELIALTPITQKGGKVVHAWAWAGDVDPTTIQSDTFTVEWPPRSGRMKDFPEVDRAEWFGVEDASRKLIPAQVPLVVELLRLLVGPPRSSG